ncbi:unnamed protein product [Cylindrotheca closterium]|uniref:Uncharacterized protein n=1 Tax=Cylindrotheca closterium TaxID=2856 RepID=A0AAD2FMK3_9STRA|nr:unnamed protein product [Cylindrotheca closterium]
MNSTTPATDCNNTSTSNGPSVGQQSVMSATSFPWPAHTAFPFETLLLDNDEDDSVSSSGRLFAILDEAIKIVTSDDLPSHETRNHDDELRQ